MDSVLFDKTKDTVVKKRSKTFKKNHNSGEAIKKKPYITKNGSEKKRRFNRKAKGAIYLGHIPHGFYENEMKSYFSQFGKVLATTVIRSKKTGRSRGYGFVEFADEEVAKIAAEAMNNYLMFNKIIKCRYIPPEERKRKIILKTTGVNDYPRKINRKINKQNKVKALSQLNQNTYLIKTQKKINEFKKFFEERGINFTFKIKSENENDIKDMDTESQPETVLSNDVQSESEDQTDDQLGVLEIDESDNEINFKTPQLKKVTKNFITSSVPLNEFTKCSNSPTEKANSLKDSNQGKNQNKKKQKAKSVLPHTKQKEKTKKKLSAKLKTKSLASVIKQKNSESLEKIDVVISKSRKNFKPVSQGSNSKELKKAKKASIKH